MRSVEFHPEAQNEFVAAARFWRTRNRSEDRLAMKCARCEHENQAEAKFCEECAAPLARTCTNCSRPLSPQAKFCPECAHPTAAAYAATIPRFTSPKGYGLVRQ